MRARRTTSASRAPASPRHPVRDLLIHTEPDLGMPGGLRRISAQALGVSGERTRTDPVACQQDARANPLGDKQPYDYQVGMVPCAVTHHGDVVWMQLTGKDSSGNSVDAPALSFRGTLWIPANR